MTTPSQFCGDDSLCQFNSTTLKTKPFHIGGNRANKARRKPASRWAVLLAVAPVVGLMIQPADSGASPGVPLNSDSPTTAIAGLTVPTDVYAGLSGNWSNGQLWSLGRSPIDGDAALLAPASGATYVSYDVVNPVTLSKFTLAATGAASITWIQNQGIMFVTGSEIVGDTGTGAVLFGGGLHTVGGGLVLGNSTNGSGTYTMFGGVLKVKGTEAILGGNGVFTQTAGANEAARLSMVPKIGSTATMNFGGGSFSVGAIDLESRGNSIINISGGVFTVNGREQLYSNGTSGTTVLNQSGGIHTIASGLELGGVYNLSGGSFSIAATGLRNFQGSTFNYSGGSLNVARDLITSSGLFNLSGTGRRVVNGSFNNAGGTVTVTKTIAEFSGAFSNSGAYVSQQADNYFQDLTVFASSTLKGASFTAGPGDRFFISGNFSQPDRTVPIYNVTGAEFHFSGGGVHQYFTPYSFKPLSSPTFTIDPGNTLNLAGGPLATLVNQGDVTVLPKSNNLNIAVANLVGPGNLTVGGGTTNLSATLTLGILNQNAVVINDLGSLNFTPQPTTATLSSLAIDTKGKFDLTQSTLILNYGTNTTPLSQVRSWLAIGRGSGGLWNTGRGLTSRLAASAPNQNGIGTTDGADGFIPSLNPGQLLIRTALYGDLNFDGKVDQSDRDQIVARGYFNDGKVNHSWTDGDVNYDGKVNAADIRLIAISGNYGPKPLNATSAIVLPADGIPSFQYDAATGDVKMAGNNGANNVVDLHLFSAGGLFLPDNSTFTGFATKTKGELENVLLGSTFGDGYDLGNILPAGLTTESVQADVTAFFSVIGIPVENPAAVVPEPSSLTLVGVGSLSLLKRRRKARSR